ncbi:hypothetical protein MES4922_670009 [Mesorhizobium ventifaucium]|uniref:SGNH hydrolase-type esterase domain-containing protein n=1 Tax=Mesorhizobium ventifaucium TaxID=666020 RepID=A0ABM9EFA7_9HYPH|nr:hypothetical protein MES4922_670009 [Mesorhizobium ventifaucium]
MVGWPNLVDTGTNTPMNYSVVMQTPAPADCYITEVDVGASGAGTANIHVIQYNGDLTVNVISTHQITLANGVSEIPLSIPIAAGQYPAISGGGYKFQSSVNAQGIAAWIRSGVLSNGAIVASSTLHRYEVAFTIKTGLIADAARALTGGTQNTGMNLLADADPNGVVDATAIFASAAAAHPNPYVPPGSFALTVMPKSGDGFWGSGKPYVGGRRFFVPARPSLFDLYDGFRAKMAEHIANNDVLCLIADSITAHGSYTFASSNTARLTSAIVQASYAGGKFVPILALGINDSFSIGPATISTNITAVLNTLEAAAAPRILAMPPTRPSSAWHGSYTGGRRLALSARHTGHETC